MKSSWNSFNSVTPYFRRQRRGILGSLALAICEIRPGRASAGTVAGLEVIVLANMGDLLTSNLSVNAFYDQIDATNLGYGANKSVFTWSGALTVSLNVAKGTMFQLNSNYSSYRLTPQGESRPGYVVNVGARQDLLDARLSPSLTVADVFHTLKRELQLSTPMVNQTVINRRDAGIVYFGLSYHFGAETKKSKEDQLRYNDGI